MNQVSPLNEPTGDRPSGLVPPGETPPAEGSLSGAGPRETYNPPRGWAKAPLALIGFVVLLFLIGLIAYPIGIH
ncbi:DUF6480 family protein [Streptomyces sp. NPDC058045]|uniref:DUF6480 family protein n=1 Tax=Streptomyces sp. NPDC058045 TaxID=3346311 RepID=UPI0036E73531